MKKIVTVFGTRPELIKLAPLLKKLDKYFLHRMVYTNQHYSDSLKKTIFKDLSIRRPNYSLSEARASFAHQLSRQMLELDKILSREKPDFVLVQGDTNSGLLGAIAAARLGIAVVHVEAGCRSKNLLAPEEQNRRMIDSISSIYFAADRTAFRNLKKEGLTKNIFLVGNTGLDTIAEVLPSCGPLSYTPEFALMTIHRRENTLTKNALLEKIAVAAYVSKYMKVIFPIHPRTKKTLKQFGIKLPKNIQTCAPLSYLAFLRAMRDCKLILSDSGGIQEEAAFVGKPCLVLREETEWVRLIQAKKNFLVPKLNSSAKRLIKKLLSENNYYNSICRKPAPGIDSGATQKIIKILKSY